MMAFPTVSDATRIWIKGREFSIGRLLGDAHKDEAKKYEGGSLAIFRLAPQDYHRCANTIPYIVHVLKQLLTDIT